MLFLVYDDMSIHNVCSRHILQIWNALHCEDKYLSVYVLRFKKWWNKLLKFYHLADRKFINHYFDYREAAKIQLMLFPVNDDIDPCKSYLHPCHDTCSEMNFVLIVADLLLSNNSLMV